MEAMCSHDFQCSDVRERVIQAPPVYPRQIVSAWSVGMEVVVVVKAALSVESVRSIVAVEGTRTICSIAPDCPGLRAFAMQRAARGLVRDPLTKKWLARRGLACKWPQFSQRSDRQTRARFLRMLRKCAMGQT